MRTIAFATAVALLAGVACTDQSSVPTQPDPAGPSFEIVDHAHNDGAEGFYFLPPLVPQPAFDGTFDGSAEPVVTICEWTGGACAVEVARYELDSGPGGETIRVSVVDEQFHLNWHTDEFDLSSAITYRILVEESGLALGHADVDVVDSGRELKNVDTDEYIALKDGRTLPVKFRIEAREANVVGPAGGTVTSADGRATLTIPAGALTTATEITISPAPAPPAGTGVLGPAWQFGPEGLEFDVPVTLMLAYDATLIPDGADAVEAVVLGYTDGGEWQEISSLADPATETVSGEIDGFSSYAPLLRVRFVQIDPPELVLAPGEQASLHAAAQDIAGRALVTRLKIWGSRDIEVATVDQNGLVTAVALGSTEVGVAAAIFKCPGLPYTLCVAPSPNNGVVAWAQVEVVPPEPVADAGPDQTVEDADGDGFAAVTLDGSGSSDANGTIVSYEWFDGPATGTPVATGVNPTVSLPVGSHAITLAVRDDDGTVAFDDVVIVIESITSAELTWTVEPSGTTNRLVEVWGSSPTDVYAAGDGASLLRFDGATWTHQAQDVLPTDMYFRGLSGVPGTSSHVVAGGASPSLGNLTFQFNGTSWARRTDIPPGYVSSVRPGAVRGISEGYWGLLVGNVENNRGRIWGTTSVNTVTAEWSGGDGTELLGVWGTSVDGTGFAVGYEWRILHYDGSHWVEQHSSSSAGAFTSVWGSAVNDVFVVGVEGTIWHYDGVSWTSQVSGTTQHLNEVFGSSDTDVYAVGDGSTVLHYDGLSWSPVDVGASANFHGVWVSDDGGVVYIVGTNGLIVAGRK